MDSSRPVRLCLPVLALAVVAYAAAWGVLTDDLPWNRKLLGGGIAGVLGLSLTALAVWLWNSWINRPLPERQSGERADITEGSLREILLGLPRVALGGFLIGFVGTWIKPVENVESLVDHLEFGALCAAMFLVLVPIIALCKTLWEHMGQGGLLSDHE